MQVGGEREEGQSPSFSFFCCSFLKNKILYHKLKNNNKEFCVKKKKNQFFFG